METSGKSSKLKVRSVLSSVVAICALLAFAASANAEIGETVEAAAATPIEAVEAPAPVPPAEPEPVQAVETTPVAEEIQPVHVPPPPKPVEAKAPSVTEQADVQELAPSVGKKGSADSVAVVAKATKTLAQGSLDAIGSAAGNALPDDQLPGIAVAPAAPSPDGSLSSPPPPQSGSLLHRPFIGAFPFQPPLMEFGGLEAIAVGSGASDHPDGRAEARLSTALETGAIPFRATIGGGPIDRSGNPAPLNVPPPAPGSPGTIASGAGGSPFVPLAALLALLALVAPAVLRRLREVPDFRPPIPFVCALERPG